MTITIEHNKNLSSKSKWRKVQTVVTDLKVKKALAKLNVNNNNRNRFKKCVVDEGKLNLAKNRSFKIILILSTICSIFEAFLISFPHVGDNLLYQQITLSVSSFFFLVQLIMTIQEHRNNNRLTLDNKLATVFTGEIIEFFCLLWGWVLIFSGYPGLAALRCIRLLQLFLLFEMYYEDPPENFIPENHLYSLSRAAHQTYRYSEKLFVEMLLPSQSRGGIIVLGMVFYITYLFSVVFWKDKRYLQIASAQTNQACETQQGCFLIMLRLALYDGTGLDFMQAVSEEGTSASFMYSILLMAYLIITAIILLSGLIGIFGQAFTDDEKDIGEEEQMSSLRQEIISTLKLRLDGEPNEARLPSQPTGPTATQMVIGPGHPGSALTSVVPVPDEISEADEISLEKVVSEANRKLSETVIYKVVLLITSLLVMLETVIIGQPFMTHDTALFMEIIVLGMSSVMLNVEVAISMIYYPIQKDFFSLLYTCFDGQAKFELFCICWGWLFFGVDNEGVAALRCVRVIRLCWIFDHYRIADSQNPDSALVKSFRSGLTILHNCVLYLKRLGAEVFTAASKGGTIILAMLFYATYLVAVVFWADKSYLDTGDGDIPCDSLSSCFHTIMRLAFYDGNGLDYLTAVTFEGSIFAANTSTNSSSVTDNPHAHSEAFSTILYIYIILASVILLNGLIGVFGNTAIANTVVTHDKEIAELKQILEDVTRLCQEDNKPKGKTKSTEVKGKY